MRSLLICGVPGDELSLFGNVVLDKPEFQFFSVLVSPDAVPGQSERDSETAWRAACAEVGITPLASLNYPARLAESEKERESAQAVAAADSDHPVSRWLRDQASQYDRVYVPNIEDNGIGRGTTTAAASSAADSLWMEAEKGADGEVHVLHATGADRVEAAANRHYGPRLQEERLVAEDFRAVRQYRPFLATDLRRFALEFLGWNTARVMNPAPWDFETSPYEADRYAMELKVVSELEWESMLEVGACAGSFTVALVGRCPGRRVTCCEPNPVFAARLEERLGENVQIIKQSISDVAGVYDVVFASSVLYYLEEFPVTMLDSVRRYLVCSHKRSYHDDVVRPLMTARGWLLLRATELAPRLEAFCGISVLKDGTEVAVWERP